MSKKFLSPIKLAQGATVPSTGSAGELFYNTTDSKIYTHNGTAWVASGGGVTNSATAPSSPANGDAWFNTTEGTLFVYYADGTSGQWVEATAPKQGVESYQLPAGSIMAWGGATAPTNWLLADGSAISRTTYASLFAAIGTQYGVGDGSTTFNLPNLKGRAVVGLDSSQTEFNILGEIGGAKTHTLLTSEMPSHTHTTPAHTHTGSTSTNGDHSHNILSEYGASGEAYFAPGNNRQIQPAQPGAGTRTERGNMIVGSGSHSHSFTTGGASPTTNSTGGGEAHNNLQPYIVLNYVIKFSAGETPGDSELAIMIGNKANVTTANTFTGQQLAVANATTTVPLISKGLASQTGDLQQWQDSTGASLAYITASGVFKNNQPAFSAKAAGSTANSNPEIFTKTEFNVGNCYNTSNGRFTAPIAGRYIFSWGNISGQNNTIYRHYLFKNGATSGHQLRNELTPAGTEYASTATMTVGLTLAANDYVYIQYNADDGSSSFNDLDGEYTTFIGYLIG